MLKLSSLSRTIGQPGPRVIWTATVCGMLVQFIVFAAATFDSYRATIASSFEIAENIAALIVHDIARNIEIYDISLQAVADAVRDPEVMALPPRLKQLAVFDRAATATGLGSMVVLDSDGTIVLDSQQVPPRAGNFADREHFRFQRDTPRLDGFYIGRPFVSRIENNNTWSMAISRRLNADDGSFAGIVSGTLNLDYIHDRMEAAALGKNGTAALLRNDGIVFAQSSVGNPNVGADWSQAAVFKHLVRRASGTFASDNSLDGSPQLFAYKSVMGFGLVVIASVSRDDVLAPWWAKVWLIAGVFVAMAAGVILLVAMFNRELRRRISAEQGQALLARKDRLSQLANRLGFDEAMDLASRMAARDRQPLSLLMIDVDQFKSFNDHYGHPEGDRVLAAIGNAIGAAVRRPGDVAARYGGEEFAVLLANTDADGALEVAESIRKRVLAMAIRHEFSGYGVVTLSLGVATIVPGKDLSPQMLVSDADRALYAAKAGGRNRVCTDGILAKGPVKPAILLRA
jgi:diguanylate cyclase (GGDEF)-like protein